MSKHPIYYVVAKATNGDEWALPQTFEDEAEAIKYMQEEAVKDAGFAYRVDYTHTTQQSKLVLNSLYGRTRPLPRNAPNYADTDSLATQPQRGDFTTTELFGWYDGTKVADRLINCKECGCAVSYDNEVMEVHRTWHNKLLP